VILSRPANDAERIIVAWLLANAPTRPGAEDLRSQIDALQVFGGCSCGCPSVDFEVGGQAAGSAVVADATGRDAEGKLVGAMVWARGGRVSGLEVYVLGEGSKCSLPQVDTLKPW